MAGSAVGVGPFVLAPSMAQIGIPASLAITAALGGLAVLTFLVIGRLLATAGNRPHVVNAWKASFLDPQGASHAPLPDRRGPE